MLSFLYLFLVVAGVVALGIIPAEKNKLKNLIAIFIGIFGIAYVMGVFTDHYGAISHETVKSGLPWFAAFVGYAVTAIIYLMCASKQQTSFNLLNVFLLAITGGIASLVPCNNQSSGRCQTVSGPQPLAGQSEVYRG